MGLEDGIASTLDAVEAGASAVAQGGRGVASGVGRVVAAGARIGAMLLRSGLSVDEAVHEIERIRPHRADEIDDEVDGLIADMPARDEETQP